MGSLLELSLQFQPARLASQPLKSACPCFPRAGITDIYHTVPGFYMVVGDLNSGPKLAQQVLYLLNHLSSPDISFFFEDD